MSRDINQIKQEYANSAAALGQISFQIEATEEALEALRGEGRKQSAKMRHLNKEALKIQKDAEEAPKAEEAPSVNEEAK